MLGAGEAEGILALGSWAGLGVTCSQEPGASGSTAVQVVVEGERGYSLANLKRSLVDLNLASFIFVYRAPGTVAGTG